MKRIILTIFISILALTAGAQWKSYYSRPDKNSQFGIALPSNQVVFEADSSALYKLTASVRATDSMATVFRNVTYVKLGGSTIDTSHFLHAADLTPYKLVTDTTAATGYATQYDNQKGTYASGSFTNNWATKSTYSVSTQTIVPNLTPDVAGFLKTITVDLKLYSGATPIPRGVVLFQVVERAGLNFTSVRYFYANADSGVSTIDVSDLNVFLRPNYYLALPMQAGAVMYFDTCSPKSGWFATPVEIGTGTLTALNGSGTNSMNFHFTLKKDPEVTSYLPVYDTVTTTTYNSTRTW